MYYKWIVEALIYKSNNLKFWRIIIVKGFKKINIRKEFIW